MLAFCVRPLARAALASHVRTPAEEPTISLRHEGEQ
ncbi:MAG: hypothetical protein JWP01_1184 [Myxococcales bacterium]|nr:hypothetical protein [Myxococcales bacterium]